MQYLPNETNAGSVGDQLDRWNELKEVLRVQTHAEAQGLVTIFIIFPSTLKTTREESKMSNFHTPLFQNSFVLVS